MTKSLHILDISNVAKIFPVQSMGNTINKNIINATKHNKLDKNLQDLDRWLAIKFEYGDQDISNSIIGDFLIEFLQIRGCSDISIKNKSLGKYNIFAKFDNQPLTIPFNTGTITASYLCCRLFGDFLTDLFIYIPYLLGTNLIKNKTIILNSEFDWSKGNNSISFYRELLQL